jgi:REP element-mobilizing transposase RayT
VRPGSIGAIVRSFKSASARRINLARRTPGAPVWQRNYYKRVIRDEDELNRIRAYIAQNPANWSEDELNPVRGQMLR